MARKNSIPKVGGAPTTERQTLRIEGRMPGLNEVLDAKSTVYGGGKSRQDAWNSIKVLLNIQE